MPANDPFEPIQPDPETDPSTQAATIYLPELLSDEFGIARSEARKELALSRVYLRSEEGKEVELQGRDKLDLPHARLEGQELLVVGDIKSYRMTYKR